MVWPSANGIVSPSSDEGRAHASLIRSALAGARRRRRGRSSARAVASARVEVEGRLEVQRLQPPLVGRAELGDGVAAPGCRRVCPGRSGSSPACSWSSSYDLVDVVGASRGRRRACPCMLRQQRGADPAGRAEAAALVGEEVREVARHLEHVAAAVEDHEGAGGGHVLEGDAAVELAGATGSTPTARRPAPPARRARRSRPAPAARVTPNGYS